ncbi:MAG: regulatory protein RecX [Brevinematia bacterium]
MKRDIDQTLESALRVSLHFIKYRPRTRREVSEKLRMKGFNSKIINEALKHLERESFIDDRLFAKGWIKERLFSKMLGKKKVILELKRKGIADNIISEVMKEVYKPEDEKENALRFLHSKFRKASEKEKFERERLIKLLISKGYSYNISEEAVRDFLEE